MNRQDIIIMTLGILSIIGLILIFIYLAKRKKENDKEIDIGLSDILEEEKLIEEAQDYYPHNSDTLTGVVYDAKAGEILQPWDIKKEDNKLDTGEAIANIVESVKQHKEKETYKESIPLFLSIEEMFGGEKEEEITKTDITEIKKDITEDVLELLLKYLKEE